MGDGVQGVKAILYLSPQALGIHKDKETTDTKVTIQNTPLKQNIWGQGQRPNWNIG